MSETREDARPTMTTAKRKHPRRRGDFTQRAELTVDSSTGAITQPRPLERTAKFQDWVEATEDQIREEFLQGTAQNWPEG